MKNKFEIHGAITVIFIPHKKRFLEASIDTTDLPVAQNIKNTWHVKWHPRAQTFYVRTRDWDSVNQKPCNVRFLHRVIMASSRGVLVDHRDHNGLNNVRENLRNCNQVMNSLNRRGATRVSSSGIRNVYRVKGCYNRWCVMIQVNGKAHKFSGFTHKEDAAEVAHNFFLVNHIYSKDYDVLRTAR